MEKRHNLKTEIKRQIRRLEDEKETLRRLTTKMKRPVEGMKERENVQSSGHSGDKR